MNPSSSGVSVVICTRDRPEQLEGCLRAVVPALRPDDELVVVDSASRTGATAQVIAAVPRATMVRCPEPGLSRARNAGLAASHRAVVAFTDDDCEPDPDWLDVAERALLDAPSRPGVVTGAVLPLGEGRVSAFARSDGFVIDSYPFDFRHVLGHGANMLWRREVLEQIGGFDVSLGAGAPLRAADDWDVFLRCLRAGHPVAYEPRSVLRHHQWRSGREAVRTRYGYALGATALALKLGHDGGAGDAEQRRLLLTHRAREGATELAKGAVRGRWAQAGGGAATLSGLVAGLSHARRLGGGGPDRVAAAAGPPA